MGIPPLAKVTNIDNYDHLRKSNILKHLRVALAENKLEVYYQPQINLLTGDLIGVEGLLRWNHPELGIISPSEFIPILEKHDLINIATEWVLSTACNTIKHYSNFYGYPLKVSVNLSPYQLTCDSFPSLINSILIDIDFPPQLLTLELIETSVIGNFAQAKKIIQTLKNWGVSFALDDFGQSYSSLAYLLRLPFNIVKIDKLFISKINSCPRKQALVKAMLHLSKSLNLEVTAEGIETLEELNFLRDTQCNYGQGYLISKPLSIDNFHHFITKHYNLKPQKLS